MRLMTGSCSPQLNRLNMRWFWILAPAPPRDGLRPLGLVVSKSYLGDLESRSTRPTPTMPMGWVSWWADGGSEARSRSGR